MWLLVHWRCLTTSPRRFFPDHLKHQPIHGLLLQTRFQIYGSRILGSIGSIILRNDTQLLWIKSHESEATGIPRHAMSMWVMYNVLISIWRIQFYTQLALLTK